MKWEDPHNPAPTVRSERESRLRLFEQLHQSPDDEAMDYAEISYRANWFLLCEHCGLSYGEHPQYDEFIVYGELTDHRLCNGDVIHP
jgi:hypothetical protein